MNHLLAFGMFFLSAVALASPLPNKPHIYIEGSAEIEVIPDQMTITLGLSDENMDVAIAKQSVDQRSVQLLAALKTLGIAAKDIATTALQVTPVFDYVDSKQVPRGSRVYRQVDITLRDLEKYGALVQALINAKISNTVDTKLSVSNEKVVSDQALIKALEDAHIRAKNLLTSQDKRLGDIYSISEFELRREESYQLSPSSEIYGNVSALMRVDEFSTNEPFEPGVIRAKAKVYVVYLIK